MPTSEWYFLFTNCGNLFMPNNYHDDWTELLLSTELSFYQKKRRWLRRFCISPWHIEQRHDNSICLGRDFSQLWISIWRHVLLYQAQTQSFQTDEILISPSIVFEWLNYRVTLFNAGFVSSHILNWLVVGNLGNDPISCVFGDEEKPFFIHTSYIIKAIVFTIVL